MYKEENMAVCQAAKNKLKLLDKNPAGYFIASLLAGAYVGFGIILIYSIGGLLEGAPYTKILMGASFGVALSLVIMAGSELFTGNNFIMSMAMFNKEASLKDSIRLWMVCYIGNWAGSILCALLYYYAGLATGATGQFISDVSATKMGIPLVPLFMRAVLCNIMVCLAVWTSFKMRSESGKLIMIFWCLFVFITSGYEHSIANMTLLSVSLLNPMNAGISLAGYLYNILVVTLGNMVGGILLLSLPYYIISKKDQAL